MNISYLFSLPLLTKELIEQAQHKRTYVLRVVYAVILYSLALWQYNTATGGGMAGLENLGRGREFFDQLVYAQIAVIMLLLPAITCGALTVEKEKDTLALLLLTKLSPWTIVFEKLLSRVFAMGTFQLISLPLFGIVQSMGGVELWEMIAAILGLMALTIAVGSVSILCSTWFRTTSEAFIMSYLAVYCLSCVFSSLFMVESVLRYRWTSYPGAPILPPTLFQELFVPVLASILSLLMSAFILLVASKVLVSRAFVPAWNIVLYLFQRADRFFNDLNARTTGGIVLVPDRETLPLFQAIAWRETRKKSLGTFRYQFRVLMLLLAPLILVISAVITDARMDFNSPFRAFPVFFWFVSVICLTIHSTGVMPSERIRQTLDVLLVAPLTAREIVIEKLSGVRRLIKVLSIPFVVLILFQAIWTGYIQGTMTARSTILWKELVSTSLSVIVYMPLLMWTGFQFGLRMRTQIQAVLCTFVAVTATCAIPLFLASMLAVYVQNSGFQGFSFIEVEVAFTFLSFLSPLQMIFGINEFNAGYVRMAGNFEKSEVDLNSWWFLAMHFTIYGMIWFWLRRNALQSFSKIVRRLESDGSGNG